MSLALLIKNESVLYFSLNSLKSFKPKISFNISDFNNGISIRHFFSKSINKHNDQYHLRANKFHLHEQLQRHVLFPLNPHKGVALL